MNCVTTERVTRKRATEWSGPAGEIKENGFELVAVVFPTRNRRAKYDDGVRSPRSGPGNAVFGAETGLEPPLTLQADTPRGVRACVCVWRPITLNENHARSLEQTLFPATLSTAAAAVARVLSRNHA